MNQVLLKKLELLTIEESKKLLKIRNKENIRNQSLNKNIITLEEHLSWLEKLRNDSKKEYYAIIFLNEMVGSINFFEIDKKIKWGIYFKDEASLIIKSLVPLYFIDYIFKKTQIEFLYLDVLKDNSNAIKFDKNFGFYIFKENKESFIMRVSKEEYEEAKKNVVLKRIVDKMKNYSFIME